MAAISFDELNNRFKKSSIKGSIFLDTSFLVALYIEESRFHKECGEFFLNIRQRGIKIFISAAVVEEFCKALTDIYMKGKSGSDWLDDYKKDKIKIPDEVINQIDKAVSYIGQMKEIKEIIDIEATDALRIPSKMSKTQLFGMDALHIVSMEKRKIYAVATIDRDFRQVPYFVFTCNHKLLKKQPG